MSVGTSVFRGYCFIGGGASSDRLVERYCLGGLLGLSQVPHIMEAKVKKKIVVVGAVLVEDGKILAAQRGEDMALAGYWEFPGGKIEEGETPEEALQRELKEELLCDATIGEYLDTTSYEYDFGIVELTTFFASLQGTEPELTEHAQIRWLKPEELDTVQWAPADVPAVEKIKAKFSA